VFAVLGSGTDNIVIAQYLGARSVAVYAVTQKLFSVTLLAQFVALPLWPAFGEAQARGDKRWARRALNRSLAATLALGGVTAIPLLLFGRTIVRLWAGSAVVPSASLLLGFAFWVVLGSYGGTISAFLNAGPLLTKQIPFFGLASLAALGLKILFVPWWGAAGAVWGTVFAYGVLYAGPAAFLAYRSLREPEGIEMARAD
jgi:O-antigen/teichoic acid export membrane protein